MTGVNVRKVTDLYNTRVPKVALDLIGIKEGDWVQSEVIGETLIIRKFTPSGAGA